MRILVAGGPRTGKTTLAKTLARGVSSDELPIVRHTDDLIGVAEWSEQSEHVSNWFDAPGPWIIEGCTVARALRKWLKRNKRQAQRPCDRLIYLTSPFHTLNAGQARMAGQIVGWLAIVIPQLRDRGVSVEMYDDPNEVRFP